MCIALSSDSSDQAPAARQASARLGQASAQQGVARSDSQSYQSAVSQPEQQQPGPGRRRITKAGQARQQQCARSHSSSAGHAGAEAEERQTPAGSRPGRAPRRPHRSPSPGRGRQAPAKRGRGSCQRSEQRQSSGTPPPVRHARDARLTRSASRAQRHTRWAARKRQRKPGVRSLGRGYRLPASSQDSGSEQASLRLSGRSCGRAGACHDGAA